MNYATIVSIFPFATTETKPGMANGNFHIPAAKDDDFILFHVTDTFFTMRIPATDNHINVPVFADILARSIVNDFASSHVASDAESRPGMFWLPGKVDKLKVLSDFKDRLEAARESQKRWFLNLVKLADDDWNQFHQQTLITEQQRYAAKVLGYEAPWLVKYDNVQGTRECPVCYTRIDSRAAKCPQCQAILNQSIVDQYTVNTKGPLQLPDEVIAEIRKGK